MVVGGQSVGGQEMESRESFRVKRARVRYMDMQVTPKSFHVWAYVLVLTKADLHQTDGYGDHIIYYPNQDNFESGRGTHDNYARTKV